MPTGKTENTIHVLSPQKQQRLENFIFVYLEWSGSKKMHLYYYFYQD
jgi:hypothetical protein